MKQLEQLLNREVANLGVLYVKLHNYHWYVKGPNFFGLHVKFEELYDSITELYDLIAELMLSLNLKPVTTLKGYLEVATIAEASGNPDACEMVSNLIKDFNLLKIEFKQVIEVGDTLGLSEVSDVLTPQITELSKLNWMLNAVLEK